MRGREKESVINLVFYAHSISISGGVKREREKKNISWLRIYFGRLPLTIPSFDFIVVIVVYLSNG